MNGKAVYVCDKSNSKQKKQKVYVMNLGIF